jgi:hypothetical protein
VVRVGHEVGVLITVCLGIIGTVGHSKLRVEVAELLCPKESKLPPLTAEGDERTVHVQIRKCCLDSVWSER